MTLPVYIPGIDWEVIAIILGGIYTGWMTPTETGAVGAALIFFMAIGRRAIFGEGMTKSDFIESMMETGKLTVMIFTIIWGVLIYVRFLGFTGLTTAFADWIVHLPVEPIYILLMILGVYIILGALADSECFCMFCHSPKLPVHPILSN